MEDSTLKRLIIVVICSIAFGKLFAASMMKLAEKTNVPVSHWLTSAFNEVTHSQGPNDAGQPMRIVKPRPVALPVFKAPIAKPVVVAKVQKPKVAKKTEPPKKEDAKDKEVKKTELAEKPFAAPPPPATFSVINPQHPEQGAVNGYTGDAGTSGLPTGPSLVGAAPSPSPAIVGATGIDIAYWTNILVNSPTATEVKQFYGYMISGQITSQQFYSVLGFMIKSSVHDSRLYAVVMASKQVNLQSFQILADDAFNSDTDVSARAESGLQSYDSVGYLTIIQSGLGGDTNEKVAAAQAIQVIATKYASTSTSTSTSPQALFTPLVSPLENLTHDPSNMVQNSASLALEALSNKLGITVASTGPGNGGTGNRPGTGF